MSVYDKWHRKWDWIKQHLSNIWSSVNEKVMQHPGWVETKSVAY